MGFSSEDFYATEATFRFALLFNDIFVIIRLVALGDRKARRIAKL